MQKTGSAREAEACAATQREKERAAEQARLWGRAVLRPRRRCGRRCIGCVDTSHRGGGGVRCGEEHAGTGKGDWHGEADRRLRGRMRKVMGVARMNAKGRGWKDLRLRVRPRRVEQQRRRWRHGRGRGQGMAGLCGRPLNRFVQDEKKGFGVIERDRTEEYNGCKKRAL